jgi:hypothetical protein
LRPELVQEVSDHAVGRVLVLRELIGVREQEPLDRRRPVRQIWREGVRPAERGVLELLPRDVQELFRPRCDLGDAPSRRDREPDGGRRGRSLRQRGERGIESHVRREPVGAGLEALVLRPKGDPRDEPPAADHGLVVQHRNHIGARCALGNHDGDVASGARASLAPPVIGERRDPDGDDEQQEHEDEDRAPTALATASGRSSYGGARFELIEQARHPAESTRGGGPATPAR